MCGTMNLFTPSRILNPILNPQRSKQIKPLHVELVWWWGGMKKVASTTENAKSFAVDTYLIIVVGRIQRNLHGNRQHGHVGFHNWACQIVKTGDR